MSNVKTWHEAFMQALSDAGISPEYQGDGIFTGQSKLYAQVFDAACEWQASRQALEGEEKIIIDRVIAGLESGFIACNRCGDQEDTATLDCMSDLKRLQEILARPASADVPECLCGEVKWQSCPLHGLKQEKGQ